MSGIDIDRIHGEAKPPVHGHRRSHTDAEQAAAIVQVLGMSLIEAAVLGVRAGWV